MARGHRVIQRPLERGPYICINGSWETYEGALSSRLRAELRRRRRRLGEHGEVSLEITDGRQRLASYLEEGFAVEAAGWKGRQGTAIASQPRTRQFYEGVARWAAGRGWLVLAFLRLDGRPLAFDLCLERSGVHYLLKTGYDPAFQEYAPGKLLRREMVARAFNGGLTTYEFLGTDQPWKLEWTTTRRSRVLVQAFRPSARGSLEWGAMALGRPLLKRVANRLRAATSSRRIG